MKKSDLSLKIYALLRPILKEELFEATVEVLEKNFSTIWAEEKLVAHTFRTAIWVHDGKYFDLDSLLFLNHEQRKNNKIYKLNWDSMIPFSSFGTKALYSREEALEEVQNHMLISYQMLWNMEIPQNTLEKKLLIDK